MKKSTRKTICVSDLWINSENPRFKPVSGQKEALELMLKEKGKEIKNIAQDIAIHGINPTKNLAVVFKNNKYLVLEGNRRVIALKLLNSPSKSKQKNLRVFFQELRDKHSKNIPNTVSCEVFQNEEDALHWVKIEHTGPNKGVGTVRWDSEQRTRYEDQYTKRKSREIQILDFTDENNLNRDNIKKTNLKRLIDDSDVCASIGISFNDEKLNCVKTKNVVKKNLKKIFTAMIKNKTKVREIYNKGDRKKWISNILDNQNIVKKKKDDTTKKTLPKSINRKHLIPSNFELVIRQNKTNDIFRELRDDLILDSTNNATPNAVAVLFRVFLECSLYHYLQKKGIEMPPKSTIKQMIDKVENYMEKNNIATKKQLKMIRITSSKSKDILHIDRLHEYVHSGTMLPEPSALKARWNNLQEFFEILWDDLEKK